MLNSGVLVLNQSFVPVHVTTVKHALCLLYAGVARAVDEAYSTFDFHSWKDLAVAEHHEKIGLVDRAMRIPRVILLCAYNRVPQRRVRFSRHNIFVRDHNTCQYCGQKFRRSDLNLDHVLPRSQGGRMSWENLVACCFPCNRRKGGQTPEQAGMKLIRTPEIPRWSRVLDLGSPTTRYKQWEPYLNLVDFAYWNLELQEE